MKLLGIFPETIRQFEKGGFVSISMPPLGAFFWAQDEDLARIREFEEEWSNDRQSLVDGEAFAYVYNHDCEWCLEFGSIGIKRTIAAGLVRTW